MEVGLKKGLSTGTVIGFDNGFVRVLMHRCGSPTHSTQSKYNGMMRVNQPDKIFPIINMDENPQIDTQANTLIPAHQIGNRSDIHIHIIIHLHTGTHTRMCTSTRTHVTDIWEFVFTVDKFGMFKVRSGASIY